MPIDPLPTAPLPTDNQATFNTKAFNLVAALGTFVTQTNAVETAVDADAATASAAATTASNAAATALAAGTSITGTSTSTLTIGTGSKSLTIETGRAFVAGMLIRVGETGANANVNYMQGAVTSYNAGTGALVFNATVTGGTGTLSTWAVRAAPQQPLSGAQTLTTSSVLTASSPTVNELAFAAFGGSVTLPAANTMDAGASKLILDNSLGKFAVGVLDGNNAVLGQVHPGDVITMSLKSNATVGGSWVSEPALDPHWFDTRTAIDVAIGHGGVNLLNLDAARSLLVYRTPTNLYPAVRLVTHNAAGVPPTVSAELVLATTAYGQAAAEPVLVGTNRVLLNLAQNRYVLVDLSNPSTLSCGTSQLLTWTSGNASRLVALDSQYVVVIATDSSALRARCLDCGSSGTTIAVGAEATTSSYSFTPTIRLAKLVGSTAVGVAVSGNPGGYPSINASAVTRTSGTSLSWSGNSGAPSGMRTDNYATNSSVFYDVASDKVLFWYQVSSSGQVRYVVITFAASSTPTYGTVASGSIANSDSNVLLKASPDRTKFIAYAQNLSSATTIEAVTVSGSTVTVGTAASFTVASLIGSSPSLLAEVDNNGRGFVAWFSAISGSGSGYDKFRTFTLSGTTFTFSTEPNALPNPQRFAFPGFANSSDFQTYQDAMPGVFAFQSSNSGTAATRSRIELFNINADRTLNTLCSIEIPGSSPSMQGLVGVSDRLVWTLNPSSYGQDWAENFVLFTNGRIKRGRTIYGFAMNINNNLPAPSQRTIPAVFLTGEFKTGGNMSIYTVRIAEA